MSLMKMKDVINGKSLFSHFQNVPWKDDVSDTSLNLVYSTRSADKFISPLISQFISDSHPTLSDADLDTIALALEAVFLINWKKLYDSVKAEYDVRDNYDIKTEYSESGNVTDTGSNTRENNSSVTMNGNSNDSSYGFNSSSSVPTDSNTNGQSNVAEENVSNSSTSNRDTTISSNTRKHGNIGVMIYPSMLKAEIDVRKWNFFEQVFSDIDSLLTLLCY